MSGGKLPEEWVKTTIGVICEVKGGKRLPKGKALLNTATEHPYIRVTDFENGSVNLSTIKYLDSDTYSAISNYTISKNDLYISIAGTIGLIGEIPEQLDNANLTENAAKLCFILGTDKKYLKHVLSSNKTIEQFDDKTTSSGQPKLALFRIRDCEFPYAPINEQKIIAEKLDTLLAQVDSTKARLEQIPQILKRFRQAVLAAAVSGLLIGSNKRNHHPLCSEWQWPDLPSTWSVHKYSELVDSRLGKMLDKAKNFGSATKYLGNINVRWFSFDLENLQDILISDIERRELSLKLGDVLICEGGEPGRCAIWSEPQDIPVIFQKALHRARVKDKIIPEWLVYNLKNDSNNISLSQLFTGTTIKHLTGKALANYPIRVPPLEEQHEIVRRVEQLFAYADTIAKQVNNALTRVNSLTQSILAKAFRGELTAQWRAENPSLISGENSAAALLEKIKAERAASGGKKTSRKKA
ncbi:type I restriction-modification system specificity subunit [Salmonella enterica subsp. enterica]|nr:type I restriction-modification system specificity subunit [Salmonella enterica subsp. enterica]